MLLFCAGATGQTPDDNSGDPRPTTAEELLETLRSRRPANEVIPPQSTTPTDKIEAKLLPEGSVVVDRAGAITSVDQWWTFTSADGETKLRLLPNLTLETMVLMTRASKSQLYFSVSGELMVFEDANYLLVRSAPRAKATPQATITAPESLDADIATPKRPEVATDDSPTDVLDILAKQGRDRPVIPTGEEENSGEGNRGANNFAGMLDGAALVDRPSRVTRQGDWWTLVFESDHPEHPEPPMRLLPCSGTEQMMRSTGQAVGGVVFTVSGEVTSFFGRNYLVPRAVTRRFASGNLRK